MMNNRKAQLIENQISDSERAFYHTVGATVRRCTFAGAADGESALKECRDLEILDCSFALRYPLWHGERLSLSRCFFAESCRAPIWYTSHITVDDCRIHGIKCLRECSDVSLCHSTVISPEFGWKCRNVKIRDSEITAEYLFFDSRDLEINHLDMRGKYSFQYTENVTVADSRLNTKDAFWHAVNVTVTDSEVIGEYLGWYSENLTLIRCHIKGTQPLCYCRNLRLIDCTMEDTDLAFEYSDVHATVKGEILSIKNPRSGSIIADRIGEVIREDSVLSCDCLTEAKNL